LHETTSWWKTYGKRLFFKDLKGRDVLDGLYMELLIFILSFLS
jgi:hypothetical protein